VSLNNFIIRLENVKKVYGKGKEEAEVFSNLNLNIPKGNIFGIIGPSGSGKSTLLNLIGGLDLPTEGKVFVKDVEISLLKEEERSYFRSKFISYVFQFFHLIPELNILENVALPLIIKNKKRKEIFKKAKAILNSLGIGEFAKRYPAEISGGEQQRVCIARALITEPEIILLDEPTGSLDHKNSEILIEIIKKIHLEKNITFVIVTHNENLKNICDNVHHLGE
jgi:ABC-type lipoprotein export system ATPase subunit